jgi:hypothetical protein
MLYGTWMSNVSICIESSLSISALYPSNTIFVIGVEANKYAAESIMQNGFVIQQSIEILTTHIHSQPDGRLKSKVVVLSIKRMRARIVKQAASVDVSGMDLERQ